MLSRSSRPRGRNSRRYRTLCRRVWSANSKHWATLHGPQDAGRWKGYKDQWRVRVGDWRVIYIIDDAASVVSVTRIAHRREIYE